MRQRKCQRHGVTISTPEESFSDDVLHYQEAYEREQIAAERRNEARLVSIFESHGWVESGPGVYVKPEAVSA